MICISLVYVFSTRVKMRECDNQTIFGIIEKSYLLIILYNMAKKTTVAKLKSTLTTLQKLARTEKDTELKALITSVTSLLDGNSLLTPTPKVPKAPKASKVKKEKKVKAPKAPKAIALAISKAVIAKKILARLSKIISISLL